jgi:hypothetical protein
MDTLRTTPRTWLTAATGITIAVALSFGYWLTTSDDADVGAWLIVSAAGTLIAGVLLLRFVPATESVQDGNAPARRALILGILSFVTILGFWTGLPIVLGVPALVLAAEGRFRAGSQGRGGEATAATVLAILGIVATFAASIFG